MVGQDAVDLLGHAPVERAQAGLDVGDRDVQLGGREGAGERRVGVAVDEQPVRLPGDELALDPGQHLAGLGAVGPGADLEVDVRIGDAELVEEDARHLVVVVLAGVKKRLAVAPPKDAGDRPGFDELGACADDGQDVHGAG